MSKLIPTLWFQADAREVAKVYNKIFKHSKILRTNEVKDPNGAPVYLVNLELLGMEVLLMSAPSQFVLNESFSLTIRCHDQAELDYYWYALTSDGGAPVMCGWLKDKFGLSWQVVPDVLEDMFSDSDPERHERVLQVVSDAIKLDFQALKDAYKGK